MISADFVLLRIAGPEDGELSLGILSDMFQSVTAEINGHWAFSLHNHRLDSLLKQQGSIELNFSRCESDVNST